MENELDADVRRLIAEVEARLLLAPAKPTLAQVRSSFDERIDWLKSRPRASVPEMAQVTDEEILGRSGEPIPIRVFEPVADRSAPADVVIFAHGGGWTVGDLDSHDHASRAMAAHLGARVVAVDYRLAPEHPFPAALHDCLDAIEAFDRDPATGRLCVAGDSSGANLAAAAALACRGRGPSIAAQLLIYPGLDPGLGSASMERYAEGYLLTKQDMAFFYDNYLPRSAQRSDPLAAPLSAEALGGLPATVLCTAGFDPLVDEGRAYAACLVEADVPTVCLPFPTLTHGWLVMTAHVPAAVAARTLAFDAFAALLEAAPMRSSS